MAIDFAAASTLSKATSTTLAGISASGITKPGNPAFHAYGVTATASGANVVFPSTTYDTRSSYSNVNGRFTAPVAGTYYFYFQHLTNSTGGEYRFVFYKNGGWYSGSNYITQAVSGQYWSIFGSQHISLAANDYVNAYYISGPASLYGGADNVWGQFSGYLIG